jgi:hypothetical protein
MLQYVSTHKLKALTVVDLTESELNRFDRFDRFEVHLCLPVFTLAGCLLLLPLNFSVRDLHSFRWAPHINVTRIKLNQMLIVLDRGCVSNIC